MVTFLSYTNYNSNSFPGCYLPLGVNSITFSSIGTAKEITQSFITTATSQGAVTFIKKPVKIINNRQTTYFYQIQVVFSCRLLGASKIPNVLSSDTTSLISVNNINTR